MTRNTGPGDDLCHDSFAFTLMKRGYHIRIVLNPESDPSSKKPFVPASLFQPLPNHSPKSSIRRNTFSRPSAENKDYRLGPITIDWVDFDYMSILHSASGKEKGRGRGEYVATYDLLRDATQRHLIEPAEATFVPRTRKKTGLTSLSEGVVHVFRDGTTKPTTEELECKTANFPLESFEDDAEGIMLGVLAVPSWMTPSDFLAFVAPAVEGIGHLRIIR